MLDPSNHPMHASLTAAETRELHALCSRLHDGLLGGDEASRLNALLKQYPAARTLYLRYVALHGELLANAGKCQFSEAELLRDWVNTKSSEESECQPSASLLASLALDERASHSALRRVAGSWQLAATLLLAASLAFFWVSHTPFNQVAAPTQELPTCGEQKVMLSYVSSGTVWRTLEAVPQQGFVIETGQSIDLAEGEVELTYSSGTKLMLVGPAEFLVEPAGGKLVRGGLVASVTEAGHGFTIETPNGKVVDLGTEFGVAVDDFGVSEVNVFKGKVEAFPGGGTPQGNKIELNQGDGLQWSEHSLVQLSADLHRFTSAVLGRELDTGGVEDGRSLVDRFREDRLDTKKWTAMGAVSPSPTGLRLGDDGGSTGRGYLISADEFDPALGPITVKCDVEFDELAVRGQASFAILSRSVDARGIAAPPWDDVLESCARCSYESDPELGGGMLRTGVKLESNREVTNISWSGFSPPTHGVPYRVVMRDDGVSVSFTVSLQDDPSQSKTVTFRSLFRGKTNHIALEGPLAGAVRVDRVEISQDRNVTPLTTYGDLTSLVLSDQKRRRQEARLLDRLSPRGAELVLGDDFGRGLIDQADWDTLEEVFINEGGVQLGRHNKEGHIDTWKQRPYLLTRQRLDPREGTLTILGRIRFAENYLAGYGASFAVITRADHQRGQGPGWENSVLQRGVRANFWPAAVDMKHTLEIHEKPTANSISLLATQGVEVDPGTRSYLFRVVDDGRSVALTVVDPTHPDELMTVAAPAAYASDLGVVAFESCWGSPINLDDVRIYRARPFASSATPADAHD